MQDWTRLKPHFYALAWSINLLATTEWPIYKNDILKKIAICAKYTFRCYIDF